jgi:hypothetical protein
VKKLSVLITASVLVLAVLAIVTIRHNGQVSGAGASHPGPETQAKLQADPIPSCSGDLSAPAAEVPRGSKPHLVTLSWKASVPISTSPRDAIRGYYVFRSRKSGVYSDRDRISIFPLAGTRCIDATVEPRNIYYYVVKSLAESSAESVVSTEIKAVIPFP